MNANKLYKQIEKDFITPAMTDDWSRYMDLVREYISDNFMKRSMGLVCDFTDKIDKVYAAVFPTSSVMNTILRDNAKNAMLFVHHPSIWDITKVPVFHQMDKGLLQQFKDRNISIYNLHVPLDNYGKYSTGISLAKALGIKPLRAFSPYFGGLSGLFGETTFKTTSELSKKFEEAVKHKVSLYQYGSQDIKDGIVAIIAGGGNDEEYLQDVVKEGVNTFVTGITALNSHSQKAHEFAKEHKINILGGTHYSTEKFACIAMCNYFRKLGLESQFINDKPGLEDL